MVEEVQVAPDLGLMRFKCEIELKSKHTIREIREAQSLMELERRIEMDYPKSKIVSIVGGY